MSSHLPYVTTDVVMTLHDRGVPFDNDLSVTFPTLLGNSPAAFLGYLKALQKKINTDPNLKLSTDLDVIHLPGTPTQTFAQYFSTRSVIELIYGLDKVLDYSPYA